MTLKTLLSAFAVLVTATTMSFAQNLPNYGANAPSTGDTYGKPPSGARPPGVTRNQRSNYPKPVHRSYRHKYVRYQ